MLRATCTLAGVSPLSFSKVIQIPRNEGETHEAFEERSWRERMHVTTDGYVFIPPNALKNAISNCAKYLSEKIPGQGKATYTKNFEAGIGVYDQIIVHTDGKPVLASAVPPNRVHVPSNGIRGGGTRVWKNFPIIEHWHGDAIIYIMDPMLIQDSEKVLEYVVKAGQFIGLLFFRPRQNGWYGRYNVENWRVTEET